MPNRTSAPASSAIPVTMDADATTMATWKAATAYS